MELRTGIVAWPGEVHRRFPRRETMAEAFVPAAVADERLQRLQALLSEQHEASIGKRTTLLLERDGKKPGQRIGKSPWLQSVHIETDAPIGELVEVELVSAGPNSLGGAVSATATAN